MDKISYNLMNLLNDPEFIYFLGYFWADGYVVKPNNRNQHLMSIDLKESDFYAIENILNKLNFNILIRRIDNKFYKRGYKGNKILYNFFLENDYHLKSGISPIKILKLIPSNLIFLWFRGLFDGDGNFNFHKSVAVTISGVIDQDWSEISNFFNSKNIYTCIRKQYSKNGNCSLLVITGSVNCINFYNLIYANSIEYPFFLKRKKEKFDIFIEKMKDKKLTQTIRDKNGLIIKEDLTGKIFNNFEVLDFDFNKHKQKIWNCKCKCGKIVKHTSYELKNSIINSCGCMGISKDSKDKLSILMSKRFKRHGLSHTYFHRCWINIAYKFSKNIKYSNIIPRYQEGWDKFDNFYNDCWNLYLNSLEKYKEVKLIRLDKDRGFTIDNISFIKKCNK